jgi:hypothetical protein
LPIRRLPVGGLQDREEIRKEIDQHAARYELAAYDARANA